MATNLTSINTQSKNSMPTFVETSLANLSRGLNDNKVQPPIFGFLTDQQCMVYVDSKRNIHKILVDRIVNIEAQLEGLVDPETQEPIKVTEYVAETVAPVETKVDTVTETVTEIQRNGAAILLTSDENGGV